ncbi:MAG: hypothetical protein WC980_09280 [Candidatus Brocadiia bacterium]
MKIVNIIIIVAIGVMMSSCRKVDDVPVAGYITNQPGLSAYSDPSGLTEEYRLWLDSAPLINYSENLKYGIVVINGFLAQGDDAVMTKKLSITVNLADIRDDGVKKVELMSGYKLKGVRHRLSVTLSFMDYSTITPAGAPGATKDITLPVYVY